MASLALLAAPAGARQTAPPPGLFPERAFPHATQGAFGAGGLRLAPAADLAGQLSGLRRVRLVDVPWPGANGTEPLTLDLERWQALTPDALWMVNGERRGGRGDIDTGLFLYAGKVEGERDSDAYLAFSSTGSFGWITRGADTVQLVSGPASDGTWTRPQVFLVRGDDPALARTEGFTCETRSPGGQALLPPLVPATGGRAAASARRVYVCQLALETDWQYYQLFGDVQAATNYAVAIFGAVSQRFDDAADTLVQLPFLEIWSTSNDPWTSEDNGGTAGDLLDEFRLAWGGKPLPGNANVAHLISGANLGGGVAYLDVLCSTTYGFAVSGNLHGMTQFPVPYTHSLNWDFYVSAHETGHMFGTPHTHDYCPPLDQCAPSGSFGTCQTAQVCQTGTIMSYCHLCPGGLKNIATEFHPTVAGLIRQHVVASCLPSYPPASAVTRDGLGVNPSGFASWNLPELGSSWVTTVDLALNQASSSVVAAVATGPAQGILVPWGEILVDLSGPLAGPPIPGLGVHIAPIPNDPSLLGLKLYTQAATFGPAGVQLQNAIDAQIGY